MKKIFCISLFIGLGGFSFGQSLGGSFIWSNNGHIYESWSAPNGISYQDAKVFALGRGGTLATITSADEQNAIVSNLGAVLPSTSYLGAQQPLTNTDPVADWAWVTGETWSYTNWNGGEPNDFNGPGSEQNLEMFNTGLWNDIGDNASGFNGGFLVEVVPEPSSVVAISLIGLGFLARKRRR